MHKLPPVTIEKYGKIQVRYCSDIGLAKEQQEDSLVVTPLKNGAVRVVLADGHWGNWSSLKATSLLGDASTSFPTTKEKAVTIIKHLEAKIHDTFACVNHSDLHRSPETSVLAFEIHRQKIRLLAYGDCRFYIVRNNKILFSAPKVPTWLGVHSFKGTKKRKSIEDALLFTVQEIQPNDFIISFTDGVDECIYEKPTITFKQITDFCTDSNIDGMNELINLIHNYGAEDNYSIAVLHYL